MTETEQTAMMKELTDTNAKIKLLKRKLSVAEFMGNIKNPTLIYMNIELHSLQTYRLALQLHFTEATGLCFAETEEF